VGLFLCHKIAWATAAGNARNNLLSPRTEQKPANQTSPEMLQALPTSKHKRVTYLPPAFTPRLERHWHSGLLSRHPRWPFATHLARTAAINIQPHPLARLPGLAQQPARGLSIRILPTGCSFSSNKFTKRSAQANTPAYIQCQASNCSRSNYLKRTARNLRSYAARCRYALTPHAV
jgi:hypothetical protein